MVCIMLLINRGSMQVRYCFANSAIPHLPKDLVRDANLETENMTIKMHSSPNLQSLGTTRLKYSTA